MEGLEKTVWLAQHNKADLASILEEHYVSGQSLAWRSRKELSEIQPGDPVLYWQSASAESVQNKSSQAAVERGGLFGIGVFTGDAPSRVEAIDDEGNLGQWWSYPSQVRFVGPDGHLPGDEFLDHTKMEYVPRAGAVASIDFDSAQRVNEYLMRHSWPSLFEFEWEPGPSIDEAKGTTELTFLSDTPANQVDYLKRADLAYILAGRLRQIWAEQNPKDAPANEQSSFVVHVDAPWGGGKTTFANYLVALLGPEPKKTQKKDTPEWLQKLAIPGREKKPKTPWYVVEFNAWQHEHVDPPWWCFYDAIRRSTFAAASPLVRIWLYFNEFAWRVFNPRFRTALWTFAFTLLAALGLNYFDLFQPNEMLDSDNGVGVPSLVSTSLVILLAFKPGH